MTRVLIIGGAGMVGQKLLALLQSQGLRTDDALDVTLFDHVAPSTSENGVSYIAGTLTDQAAITALARTRFDVIFHLAAIVSGEAEQNFSKGWGINMLPMWSLLEALRHEHDASQGRYCPKIIFTSSIAVFGPPYPEEIDDSFHQSPQTSYGAQKAISELMLSDFSRKGFVDGISLRLPTICVRPGKPNLAASSFFSGIIREPLNGQRARLPVDGSVRHWHASPRSAAQFLRHAALLSPEERDETRALNLPGVSCTVDEQIEALRAIAGQKTVDLIDVDPDPDIIKIVSGWPRNFAPKRALELGFQAEQTFSEIIQVYIEDDLPRASA